MAEDEFGLYTIVRPGPYICAEWASGGFPNWLPAFRPETTKRPMWYRSDDPVFIAWSNRWYDAVAKVVRGHQLTHKPVGAHGVILWQVENEYGDDAPGSTMKRDYVRDLMVQSQKDGIDVPIFTCWTSAVRYPQGDPILSQAFDNPNQYPWRDIEGASRAIEDQHQAEPWAPKMITEFQGGWFGGVGGRSAAEQEPDGIDAAQIDALTLWTIGHGMAALNYYMLFGGTNFGDWAGRAETTSYDYDAPLREWGGTGPKYRVVKAVGGMLSAYGPDLARSETVAGSEGTTDGVAHIVRVGKGGAHYVFYWNKSLTASAKVDPGDGHPLTFAPFTANVFRYAADPREGSWIANPEPAPTPERLPASVRLTTATVAAMTPTDWKPAPENPSTTRLGVWDSRFLSYRVAAPAGTLLWAKAQDSELVGDAAPAAIGFRGGDVYAASGTPLEFVLWNPGWDNGGPAMERPHGIVDATLWRAMPEATDVGGWRTKILADPKDRSLAGENVDTTNWADGVDNRAFLPHTTGVVRGVVTFAHAPSGDTVLDCGGVDDEGWFYVNGHLVGEVHDYNVPVSFRVGPYLHAGRNSVAIVIRNNDGTGGLTGAVRLLATPPVAAPAPFAWTDRYRASAPAKIVLDAATPLAENEHPKLQGPRPAGSARLVRSTLRFDRPDPKGIWQIVLRAGGDGFLTLNGHPLGRYSDVGPQRGFYLPDPWLKAHNVLELTVVPGRLGDRIKAAELRPLPKAE